MKCWYGDALYSSDKYVNNHESRFNLFGLINQQCPMFYVCGRTRTHGHQVGRQAPCPI